MVIDNKLLFVIKMIFRGTTLRIVDNSGGVWARCIGIYKNYAVASVGDLISVTILKAKPHRKVQRKQIYRALIVRSCSPIRSSGTFFTSFDNNCIVLLKKNEEQLFASRIVSPVSSSLRKTIFRKFLSVAPKSI